jgi:hypothetical protein
MMLIAFPSQPVQSLPCACLHPILYYFAWNLNENAKAWSLEEINFQTWVWRFGKLYKIEEIKISINFRYNFCWKKSDDSVALTLQFLAVTGRRQLGILIIYLFITFLKSLHSSLGIETGYGLERWGLIQCRGKCFLFPIASRPALGPTQPHIQWTLGKGGFTYLFVIYLTTLPRLGPILLSVIHDCWIMNLLVII